MNNALIRCVRFSYLAISLGLLTACSTNPKDAVFAKDGPTMAEIYQGHRGTSKKQKYGTGYSNGDLESYTRDSESEIEQLFPELPNPRLVMYVFPHLTKEGAPVPGYSTSFYLYKERQIFALPGEVE